MMHQLRIEKLVNGGDGFGRWNDKAVFIPYCAPGDLVNFRPLKEKKSHIIAEVVDVVEPSPSRCQPHCKYFADCGGCAWQFLPYEEQARWKEKIFAETIIFKTGVAPELFAPIIQADPEWGYRSRVQLKCRSTKDRLALGFYRRSSHSVVDIEHCPLMPQQLNDALTAIRSTVASLSEPALVSQIDLSVDDEGSGRMLFHIADTFGAGMNPRKGSKGVDRREGDDGEYSDDAKEVEARLMALANTLGFDLFVQNGKRSPAQPLCGSDALYVLPEGEGGVRLAYGAGGFAQVHLQQNRNLVKRVLDLADLSGDEQVLDLFCGMGNMTLPLARSGCTITGIEESVQSIAWAKKNAVANGMGAQVSFFADKVERWMTSEKLKNIDLVLLDPPRSGAAQVVAILADSCVPKIIYVSCDPATLARDLALLVKGGYRIANAVAADLFPQTSHIEGVVVLERD